MTVERICDELHVPRTGRADEDLDTAIAEIRALRLRSGDVGGCPYCGVVGCFAPQRLHAPRTECRAWPADPWPSPEEERAGRRLPWEP